MPSTSNESKLIAREKEQIISELMCDYAAAYIFTSDDNDQAQLEWTIGAFEEITGHPIPEAHTNFRLSAPVHPDDLEKFKARQAKLRAGLATVDEFRIIQKNGEVRWLVSRGQPEWDHEHQKVKRVYVGVLDITERKRSEEKLRRSEEKYRHLLETSIQGIVLYQDGRFAYCNPSMSQITGYTVSQMLDMSPEQAADLVHPDDRADVAANIRNRLDGNLSAGRAEHRIINADGDVRHVEIYASLTTYEGRPAIQGTYIDVTEQKQAQEKLAHSAAIIKSSEDAIISKDLDGIILSWNPAAEQIYGYQASEAIGKSIHIIVPPDRVNEVSELLASVRCGESVEHFETVRVHKDGHLINISLTISPIRDESGKIYGASVIAQDITERKKIENALRENEAQLRLITGNMSDLIIHTDGKGYVKFASPSALRMWDNSPEDLIYSHFTQWFKLIHPNDIPILKERLERRIASRQGPPRGSFRIRFGPDDYHWHEYTVNTVENLDGTLVGYTYVIREVDTRMRAVLALQASEGRLKQAINVARLGIWEWDIHSDETIWMGEMFRMYGITPEEFTGKGADYLAFTLPEDRQMQQDNINQAFERGLTERELMDDQVELAYQPRQFRILRPDGTICYVQGDAIAIVDDDGKPVRMIGVLQDVTEQRAIEAAMQQAQKLESLGVLAGSVAHDFNNLLTGILTHTSLIELKLGTGASVEKNLKSIIESAERAAKITNQLLAYTGRGRFNITQFNLNDEVQKNMALLQATLPKNIDLTFDAQINLPMLIGDIGQIQQVIMNLIINAADAYDGQPGEVKLKTAVSRVSKSNIKMWENFGHALQPGLYISLNVSDNGHGMNNKTLNRIFDPFFTTKETGRGLGLAAVQGIIRGHRGALKVQSQEGIGTKFEILFPISDETVVETATPQKLKNAKAGNQLILVVDDEEAIRVSAGDSLRHFGYRVLVAKNGDEAINYCRQYASKISLILLDITMPVLSGLETINLLQQQQLIYPIVLMSGYDEEEFNAFNRPKNVVDFLKKPFRIETLVDMVASNLNKMGIVDY